MTDRGNSTKACVPCLRLRERYARCRAKAWPKRILGEEEKHLAAALMRVNHSGEICAQALYQGQALTAREPEVQKALEQAAGEETEHLNWCESRIAIWAGVKAC